MPPNTMKKTTKISLFLLFIFSSFGALLTFAQTTTSITTSGSGTFTVPCGVTSLTVEAWGGGGAGGGSSNNSFGGGAGGGSGAYVKGTYTVTPGTVIPYYVGNGGTGITNSDGGDAEATTITSLGISSGGGKGGKKNSGAVGAGGLATGGTTTNTNGTNGASSGTNIGGNGGTAPNGGAGGAGRSNNDGDNGTAPGGGGGGGEGLTSSQQKGGNGGNGKIIFSYTASSGYCSPTYTTVRPITKVVFGDINNSSSSSTSSSALEVYCNEAYVEIEQSYSISVTSSTNGSNNYYISVFVDWDQNGTFETSEGTNLGINTNSGTVNSSILVPATAAGGTTIMRVIQNYNAYPSSACSSFSSGQAEDYKINVANTPCSTPAAQPTGLTLSTSENSISGSFTAASPAPDKYIVLYSTYNTPPTLNNGTTYTTGSTYSGYTVVANTDVTSFTASGLALNTNYYFYVFSYNSNCVGSPYYLTSSPLSEEIFLDIYYCQPVISQPANTYIKEVKFLGTLNDVSNTSTYSTGTYGYQDFTGLDNISVQAQGEGINIFVESNVIGTMNAWIDWNMDGDFTDSGENIYSTGTTSISSTTLGIVIPEDATLGTYRLRIRIGSSSSCDNSNSGETEDYIFYVIENCSAIITFLTPGENCGEGSVLLSVTGSSDTSEFRWYDSKIDGELIGTSVSGDWNTPVINTTSYYYVTAYNGSCESLERTEVKATIKPVPSLTTNPENPMICGEDSIIALEAGGETEEIYLIDEDFETGTLNTFTYQAISSSTNGSQWQVRQSPYIPDVLVWFPAISSGFNGNSFAMSTSDLGTGTSVNNAIVSSAVNTVDFTSLRLTFDIYYSNYYENSDTDRVLVEISTNNGASWDAITTYTTDQGQGTDFETKTFDLTSFINVTQLKIRFRYSSGWRDGVAIDNIILYGYRPLSTKFLWSGAEINAYLDEECTLPYVEGSSTTSAVYIKPTDDQLESSEYTFTVSAQLTNGCIASKDVTVTNNTKVWKGYTTEWNDPNNWLPADVPSEDNCVLLKNLETITLPEGLDVSAYSLKVKSGGDFTIEGGASITLVNQLVVEDGASFVIENDGSLIQIDDIPNLGDITVKKETYISRYDYVYWSSPVADFDVQDVSPATPISLIWQWIPTISNSFGNWVNTSEDMEIAKGYSIRAPMNYPLNTDTFFQANFLGIPNNGTIYKNVQRGNYTGDDYDNGNGVYVTKYDDNWNLVGNPYPSAISIDLFLEANPNIEGAVHLWTHGLDPSNSTQDPFYSNYTSNYSSNDYETYNVSGSKSGPGLYSGFIASGQGFYIKLEDGSASTETVMFNNDMRNNTFPNNNFYKFVDATDKLGNVEDVNPGRFWLDLSNNNGSSVNRIMIGYVPGATNQKDRLFDAYSDEGVSQNFYSITDTDNKNVVIQGRALPFETTDTVPIGLLVPSAGNYTLSIAFVDGLFGETSQQPIYVEDTYLNATHDLTAAPYTFTVSAAGRYNNRFVIKYTSTPLKTDSFVSNNDVKVVSVNSETIKVVSSLENITSVKAFDLTGKEIISIAEIDGLEKEFYLKSTGAPILIHINTNSGYTCTKKIIH